MFAGVATGVRNEAAAATLISMRNGRADSPKSSAEATAMGTMISAVAVLLTNWPMIAVITNRPSIRAYGP